MISNNLGKNKNLEINRHVYIMFINYNFILFDNKFIYFPQLIFFIFSISAQETLKYQISGKKTIFKKGGRNYFQRKFTPLNRTLNHTINKQPRTLDEKTVVHYPFPSSQSTHHLNSLQFSSIIFDQMVFKKLLGGKTPSIFFNLQYMFNHPHPKKLRKISFSILSLKNYEITDFVSCGAFPIE